MAKTTTGYVDLDDGKMYYEMAGDGDTLRQKTWLVADSQPFNPLDPPAIGRVGTVHVPALIMAGTLDHPEVLRAADVMTDAIKGAKKHIFSQSAHVPNMEEPEEFTQVVLSFLAGLK